MRVTMSHVQISAVLLGLSLILAGCTSTRPSGSNAPYIALADKAAHDSLDAVNRSRAAKSLGPLQLLSEGVLPNDTLDGRSVLVGLYAFDPPTSGGRFMVYVFKDNNEVRVLMRD